MDWDDDGVLEAARAIRPYLGDLTGPTAALDIDRQLAAELAGRHDKAATAVRIRTVLEEHEDTAWFLRRVLDDKPLYRPPYLQQFTMREISGPAGDCGVIEADRYACPHGDYAWYRPDVGTPVPRCPDHHVALIRG